MAQYKLTHQAAHDIEGILTYGIAQFGVEEAAQYRDGLKDHLSALAETPLLYQAVDHIRPGYRRSVYGSHAVYYRIEDRGVLIVRILGQQDIGSALP